MEMVWYRGCLGSSGGLRRRATRYRAQDRKPDIRSAKTVVIRAFDSEKIPRILRKLGVSATNFAKIRLGRRRHTRQADRVLPSRCQVNGQESPQARPRAHPARGRSDSRATESFRRRGSNHRRRTRSARPECATPIRRAEARFRQTSRKRPILPCKQRHRSE